MAPANAMDLIGSARQASRGARSETAAPDLLGDELAALSRFQRCLHRNGSFVVRARPTKDVVATAVEAGHFKTLAKALEAAGLVETLKGKGPFTVFAPSDEAFAKLPSGTLDNLLKPENKESWRQSC